MPKARVIPPRFKIPTKKNIRKHLCKDAQLSALRSGFELIPDHRCGVSKISLPDVLMSGFAVFDLKDPSLRQVPLPKGQETILLVEDEPDILFVTAKLFGKQGYNLLTAGTPGEAVRLAHEHAGEINLLITDVIMPEMNGKDLADKLQFLNPKLKCLYMSGYTDDIIAHHGVLDEGVHFIQKPFSLPDLAIKVRDLLDY